MKTPTVLIRAGVTAAIVGIWLAGCSKPVPTAATTPTPTPVATASSETADGDVTSNVKTALMRDTGFKGADIAVVTLKGDVRLTGVLDNQSQIDSAIKIARATEGVHSIHDELTVRK
jgi:osmotically-inducible protein OsmY